MKLLSILVCGGDAIALQRIAQRLTGDGVKVETSTRVIDNLCFSGQQWDFLLIDLDSLTSFLRSLLPAICRNFPNLPIVGISTSTNGKAVPVGFGLELDDCLFEPPQLEELIVRFPHVAADYLSDTGPLNVSGTNPLPGAILPG